MSSFSKKLEGFNAIKFQNSISEQSLMDLSLKKPNLLFSSQQWHQENLVRNEEFKDTIQKSKYMSRMFKSELEYQSLNLLTSLGTGIVLTTGIALGVGIVGGGFYILATQSNAGEAAAQIIGIGLLVGGEIYQKGIDFYSSTQNKIQSERKDYQDLSRFYRYVRFIPDYFIVDTNSEFLDHQMKPFLKIEHGDVKVRIYFQP